MASRIATFCSTAAWRSIWPSRFVSVSTVVALGSQMARRRVSPAAFHVAIAAFKASTASKIWRVNTPSISSPQHEHLVIPRVRCGRAHPSLKPYSTLRSLRSSHQSKRVAAHPAQPLYQALVRGLIPRRARPGTR